MWFRTREESIRKSHAHKSVKCSTQPNATKWNFCCLSPELSAETQGVNARSQYSLLWRKVAFGRFNYCLLANRFCLVAKGERRRTGESALFGCTFYLTVCFKAADVFPLKLESPL
jgi:hypothetical protein